MIVENKFNLKILIFVFSIFITKLSFSQDSTGYSINASLLTETDQLVIKQKISFTNQNDLLNKIYLNDWANSYSSTKSPLADRLVEEYTRSFYLSSKSKRGYTLISNIYVNGIKVNWKRNQNNLDIIEIILENPIKKGIVNIDLSYVIKLPSSKYTGYGKIKKDQFFLENFFITLSNFDGLKQIFYSNLDLEEVPINSSKFRIELKIDKDLNVYSSLDLIDFSRENGELIYLFESNKIKQVIFLIGKNDFNIKEFKLDEMVINININSKDYELESQKSSMEKIFQFIKSIDAINQPSKILITEEKYSKRPFYGLSIMPTFLNSFSRSFEFEIKALSVYLQLLIKENFNLDSRKDYWFESGLYYYLMLKYLKNKYPDKLILDEILKQPILRFLLRGYKLSTLASNDLFLHFHEFMIRRNLHQEIILPKNELTRYNEQIGNPSQSALLFNYLINSLKLEMNQFLQIIKKENLTGEKLVRKFQTYFNTSDFDNFDQYLNKRTSIDLSFEKIEVERDSIKFVIKEKNDIQIPFSVGFVNKESKIDVIDFDSKSIDKKFIYPNRDYEYLQINPYNNLPEFNRNNNVKRIDPGGFKKLKFSFVKDIEDPYSNQIFYNPRLNFNAYDGILVGTRLNNKTIKSRPFIFVAEPFYSTRERTFVGSFSGLFSKYIENSNYYLKTFSFSSSTYHYDQSLRYRSLGASYSIFKRNKNLRDNRKQALVFSLQYVNREKNAFQNLSPDYNVGSINYIFSNKGALNYFTLIGKTEFSSKFGKIHLTTDYRHLTKSGRQISLRLFAGKFFWKNTSSSYFDFALDRPTDYLFQYQYLGRSEQTGIYSQQFIFAEGGFKTKFINPYSNDLLVTLNAGFGLWKWLEGYLDFGLIKNKNEKSRFLFDSGLRINVLPDYLELFFPIYNSNGFELTDDLIPYSEKIRFLLTLQPKTLTKLFTRKWF
ncbi:MAG: hypothetical protein ACJ0PY_00320 [Flavobacteriaceae bacterium]|tara:strand:- start:20640 stop:23471 length:2832 start_codon:yes stop_codon:yes gene_type:complete